MTRSEAKGKSARAALAYAGGHLSLVLLLLWARQLSAGYLVAASLVLVAALVLALLTQSRQPGTWWLRAGLILQLVAVIVGFAALRQFSRIEFDWPAVKARRETELRERLEKRLAIVVARGRTAAMEAARAAEGAGPDLFERLADVRKAERVEALAVVAGAGDLMVWAGDHRGVLPEEIRTGDSRTYYTERPLLSYLYFTAPIKGSVDRAIAAVLVETGLVSSGRDAQSRLTFAASPEVRATFRAGPGYGDDVAWRLTEGSDTIVHARLQRVTQAETRSEVVTGARRLVLFLALMALISLVVGWTRRSRALHSNLITALPLVASVVMFAVAPFGALWGLDTLFSPSLFVLTPVANRFGLGDISLGTLFAVLVPLGMLVATYRPPALERRRYWIALAAGTAAVTLAYPAVIQVLLNAASPTLLEGGSALWFWLQTTAVLLLTVITSLALPRRPPVSGPAQVHARQRAWMLGGAALVTSVILACVTLLRLEPWDVHTPWPAALWVVPFLLAALAIARFHGRRGLLRFITAGWLSATAVLPHLWLANANARLDAASREIATLGGELPPALDFLLYRFGRDALVRHEAGEDGLQLLYRSWVASGLAQEPYGVRITLWSAANVPEVELILGGAQNSDSTSSVVRDLVTQARNSDGPRNTGVTGDPNVNSVLTVPLGDSRVISVSVPPRRSLEQTSVVAPFLGGPEKSDVQLQLVEPQGTLAPPVHNWIGSSARGWRRDVPVRFIDGEFHAHAQVVVPGVGIRLARGVLLIAVDLVVLVALWFLGNAARGLAPFSRGALATLAGTFRARVTVALFAFFLAPTALFGWVAYGAFANEVERAAGSVARREVRQTVKDFTAAEGNLDALSARRDADVLYYYNSGELAQVSSIEALGLGVYSAWLSPDVFRSLSTGEQEEAEEVRGLGDQSYVVAYHKLRPAGILAVPIVLSLGETAVRQRELAHLLLFAALLGALLSLTLSVAVGRALAGPIGLLRRAASAVGAGRLRVRLTEPTGDEFGQLFASFNRMVRRLRRARHQERQTARVLAWGEMARQVAHEIKNPLTPIKLSVQHLRRAYRDNDENFGEILDQNVDQILIEIDRLTEIARAFSRYGAPEMEAGPLEPVDVRAVVTEALMLYRTADETVIYSEEVDPALPRGLARSGELKEVILNLVENARAALDGGGSISVRAAEAAGLIELEVRDDGRGIPAALLPLVFDPHFSTRSTGTGLGLAIVRRLVTGWGGEVTAESEPGRGTTIRVRILIARDPQRAR